jgi:hypothetical protein
MLRGAAPNISFQGHRETQAGLKANDQHTAESENISNNLTSKHFPNPGVIMNSYSI